MTGHAIDIHRCASKISLIVRATDEKGGADQSCSAGDPNIGPHWPLD